MEQRGIYLYCIADAVDISSFGKGGIENEEGEIFTVIYKDICAVVSDAVIKQYRPTRKNNIIHEGVIEKVMVKHNVLPFRFGIVANSIDGTRKMLEEKYSHFKQLLGKVNNKFEMGIKVTFSDLKDVLCSVSDLNPVLAQLRREKRVVTGNQNMIVEVGKMIESELKIISLKYKDAIFEEISAFADESIANENISNEMVLNASFLIEKDKEEAFDKLINDLDAAYGNKLNFKCAGPFPPYNFVKI